MHDGDLEIYSAPLGDFWGGKGGQKGPGNQLAEARVVRRGWEEGGERVGRGSGEGRERVGTGSGRVQAPQTRIDLKLETIADTCPVNPH